MALSSWQAIRAERVPLGSAIGSLKNPSSLSDRRRLSSAVRLGAGREFISPPGPSFAVRLVCDDIREPLRGLMILREGGSAKRTRGRME